MLNILIAKHLFGYDTLEAEDSTFGPALYLHDPAAQRDGTATLIGGAWERLKVGGVVGEYYVRLCPNWSGDIAAAWTICEYLKGRPTRMEAPTLWGETAEHAARLICEHALAVLGVPHEE